VIGKGGQGVEILKAQLSRQTGKTVILNIIEIKAPRYRRTARGENIASQLERRISFRRAMKAVHRQSYEGAARSASRPCAPGV
jgi:small subunit ribosomal protein S3